MKECYAVLHALRRWSHLLQSQPFHVYCDNTSVLGALHRGYSQAAALNSTVRKVCDLLDRTIKPTFFQMSYIRSEDNFADAPSRGAAIDLEQLRSLVAPLGSGGVVA